jgi:lactate permease
MEPTLWQGLLALLPVLTLLALTMSRRVSGPNAALVVLVLATVVGLVAFQATSEAVVVALGKGLWLGTWILAVVWPATLLYRIAEAGGFSRIGAVVTTLFPNRRENLLVVAWILPSFVQGVAGFGAPIAVAAPLLLACGWSRVKAVAYPLIGYHWSVTFGSMGSSFYMASLTATLTDGQADSFAGYAALFLAINCMAAGALLLLLEGGLRGPWEGRRLLVLGGAAMTSTLVGVALVLPAIASVAAGAAGFVTAVGLAALDAWRRRRRAGTDVPIVDSGEREAAWIVAPFFCLLATALAVNLLPAARAWVQSSVVLAPSFPATATGLGWTNHAVSSFTPLEVFGHPGVFIILACGVALLIYHRRRLWDGTSGRVLFRRWRMSVKSTTISILALASAATMLVETGMVSALANAAASSGPVYPALAPVVGALGSFLSGSSTSSNALFSAFQAEVASLLSVPEAVLLAGQTAGANVGNSVSPVVILVGVAAVGAEQEMGRIFRLVAVASVPLLAVLVVATLVASAS